MSTRHDFHAVVLGGLAIAAIAIALAGCGAGQTTSTTTTAPRATTGAPPATTAAPPATAGPVGGGSATAGAGALTAEAGSSAAGDIPDNQVFLTFHEPTVPFSMQYPEGWAQTGSGGGVTFKDKNNTVRVVVSKGSLPTVRGVQAQMAGLARGTASLKAGRPQPVRISGAPAVKVTYTTKSAPSPVTGKSVTLAVDRYYLAHGGRVAMVDLGTPQGVDNVDAFRQMIESFRWR